MTKTIKVKLTNNTYPIVIGNNSLQKAIEEINKSAVSKCLLLTDENVFKYHTLLIRKIFTAINCNVFRYSFLASEKNKSLKQVEYIYKFLSDNRFDRNSAIVVIGGGITGDIAGFVASSFMRGIRLFQFPTTLLSMIDSSIGGKTGVNFNHQKNQIGTFYQPRFVAIHPEFITTLPEREQYSGAGEMFKYAFLADDRNYNYLKNNLKKLFLQQSFDIEKSILTCLKIKTNIVEYDEQEKTGLRKILNFGHTFAHAFESSTNYKLKHGQAVIGGIYCALFLSESLGYLSADKLNKFINDFKFIKPAKILFQLDVDSIFESMINDKKNMFGKNTFVLIQDIGNIVVDVVVSKSLVLEAIEKMKRLI